MYVIRAAADHLHPRRYSITVGPLLMRLRNLENGQRGGKREDRTIHSTCSSDTFSHEE
jgi:hypothetical protein